MSEPKAAKRNLFDELMQGIAEMKAHREGKLTLRIHKVLIDADKRPVKASTPYRTKENQ